MNLKGNAYFSDLLSKKTLSYIEDLRSVVTITYATLSKGNNKNQ